MNLGALLPMLFPLISKFLRGKSGDELGNMLDSNAGGITDIVTKAMSGGGLGGLGGGAAGVDPNATLTTLMPLLMKQQPIIVVQDGKSSVNAAPANADDVSSNPFLEQQDPGLMNEIMERLAKLEGKK